MVEYAPEQQALIDRPPAGTVWLEGPAGAGKTTAAVGRLRQLLARGVPAEAILVLVPQRTLGLPYLRAVRQPTPAGGVAEVLTVGALARRMVELFWPLVREPAGFALAEVPPTFLTLESAQYYMARIVRPLLEEARYFDTVALDRNRLYSQLFDNLNKAAVVGFPHAEVGARLQAAWAGDEAQRNVYDNVQDCLNQFRAYCLAHNLLDFSLQFEVFVRHLWPQGPCRQHVLGRCRHLIADNVEEFTPVEHDLLADWLSVCDSALLCCDEDAGYRLFLGADPQTAAALAARCADREAWPAAWVSSPEVQALERRLCAVLERPSTAGGRGDPRQALRFEHRRFHPEMVDWVAEEVCQAVREAGTPPGEIVILAPFLSDALRFSLRQRLEALEIPVQSHRPSRAIQEEPAVQCLLTWAALAHPDWGEAPTEIDVAHALQQSVADLDPVRARLLAETVYRADGDGPRLLSFDQLQHEMQERVTYLLGGRYEGLRIWLNDYRSRPPEPLDHCLSRLFGEVLSQVGYGFHQNFDGARAAANLVESVQKFRRATAAHPLAPDAPPGREYLALVRDGVIAAQYVQDWQQAADAVLLAPAYTFLLANRAVDVQFWLNVNSPGWWERILQPLTHPHVLSRHWPAAEPWTDEHELAASADTLHRVLVGLLRRCRRRVVLGLSELDEQGLDQRGPLLGAVQQVLRELAQEEDD